MMLALSTFVSLLLLWWVCTPLWLRDALEVTRDRELAQERIQSLLKALKALGQGQKRMVEEDVRNIETRLMLELTRLYHQLGVEPGASAPTDPEFGKAVTADQPTCLHCGNPRRAHYLFCPACGYGFHAA